MIEKIVLSIVLAFLIAQTSKLIRNYKKTGTLQWSSFLQNGGMPSSHTATAIALTTSIFIETGWSYYFIICALFSVIVMNDAMKVRRETGEEAEVLNVVMEKENIIRHKLTERVGHTPLQVAVGFVLGIVIALVVYAF